MKYARKAMKATRTPAKLANDFSTAFLLFPLKLKPKMSTMKGKHIADSFAKSASQKLRRETIKSNVRWCFSYARYDHSDINTNNVAIKSARPEIQLTASV